jgi:hypothetical protein
VVSPGPNCGLPSGREREWARAVATCDARPPVTRDVAAGASARTRAAATAASTVKASKLRSPCSEAPSVAGPCERAHSVHTQRAHARGNAQTHPHAHTCARAHTHTPHATRTNTRARGRLDGAAAPSRRRADGGSKSPPRGAAGRRAGGLGGINRAARLYLYRHGAGRAGRSALIAIGLLVPIIGLMVLPASLRTRISWEFRKGTTDPPSGAPNAPTRA